MLNIQKTSTSSFLVQIDCFADSNSRIFAVIYNLYVTVCMYHVGLALLPHQSSRIEPPWKFSS